MPKIMLMFSGQGAQAPGMGRELYDASPAARSVYDEASAALGRGLDALGFDCDAETLSLTINAQPAILTLSLAIMEELRARGLNGDGVAGFSLGEIGALCAAGVMTRAQAVTVIAARAGAMQAAAEQGGGAMFAVMGLAAGDVERICAEFEGNVLAVNYNAPGQTVIAGELSVCEAACARMAAAGASRCARLSVSAAFHSPQMARAAEEFYDAISDMAFARPALPVYSNITGGRLEPDAGIPCYLRAQMASPVRWEDAVRAMVGDGYDTFLELGPGRTLCGLVRRIDRTVKTFACDTPGAINTVIEAVL